MSADGPQDTSLGYFDRIGRTPTDAHETALACLEAGIDAALPERVVEQTCSVRDGLLRIDDGEGREYTLGAYDRVVVVGGGKAGTGVATGLAGLLGNQIDDGVVISTPRDRDEGSGDGGKEAAAVDDPGAVRIREGDHPTPTPRNVEATAELLELVDDADENTLVLAVITGGASALLCAPAADLSLADLRETTDALLESGASIDEINAVRKHCSAIKGGQLAQRCAPATVCTLALSDVVGDDRSVIGSGPTVPDRSTYADALAVVGRYDLRDRLPDAVVAHLEAGAAGERAETPTTIEAGSEGNGAETYHLLAGSRTAIDAAREVAAERGYETLVLSSRLRGEAREVGRMQAAIAEEMSATGDPISPPAVVLSGGEVTVTVAGEGGAGGPNQELALAAGIEFAAGGTDAVLASVDTDGIDGPSTAAGAIVDRETVADAGAATEALDANDVTGVLEAWNALLEPGYTGTNVNDLRALVVPAQVE
ncbi:DUF4147 domain-containing protein [Halobacteria archaeon AArc-dxtr1]|nr:DUF4147 domain-containing protein [Halobacteria archaeon AArc-dxtr1]